MPGSSRGRPAGTTAATRSRAMASPSHACGAGRGGQTCCCQQQRSPVHLHRRVGIAGCAAHAEQRVDDDCGEGGAGRFRSVRLPRRACRQGELHSRAAAPGWDARCLASTVPCTRPGGTGPPAHRRRPAQCPAQGQQQRPAPRTCVGRQPLGLHLPEQAHGGAQARARLADGQQRGVGVAVARHAVHLLGCARLGEGVGGQAGLGGGQEGTGAGGPWAGANSSIKGQRGAAHAGGHPPTEPK